MFIGIREAKIIVTVAASACFLNSISLVAGAQTEAQIASKIIKIGGNVSKDDEGKIKSIFLSGNIDGTIEDIDFSMLTNLKAIMIFANKMTDRSLLHLAKTPPGLEFVYIDGAQVIDKGLIELLQKQKSLHLLVVSDSKMTDLAMPEIGKLKDLTNLTLAGTGITGKGIKNLLDLRHLSTLDLARTDISDAGLQEIKQLTSISTLSLDGTKVTDAGILQLGSLTELRWLGVSSTKVTEKGKKALQKLLPELNFEK
jgi:internalin A